MTNNFLFFYEVCPVLDLANLTHHLANIKLQNKYEIQTFVTALRVKNFRQNTTRQSYFKCGTTEQENLGHHTIQ